MKIAYVAQDVHDAAVIRRVAMLRAGGAQVELFSFRRGEAAEAAALGVHDLGRTIDGRHGHRALAMLERAITAGGWAGGMRDADVVLARNLDNLALAAAVRRRLGLRAMLAYEMLDVHASLLGEGMKSRLFGAAERLLMREVGAVVVSSEGFEREYLAHRHGRLPPTILVENKVFSDAAPAPMTPRPTGPPWKIGWYGLIRCKRSLECLAEAARRLPGQLEVHIRGRLAATDLGDVDALMRTPGVFRHGPYAYPDDLERIYGEVHFAWVVDRYPSANSQWLLPNRLYEGGLFGAVPIAVRSDEAGRWLARRNLGLLINSSIEEALQSLMSSMTPAAYLEAFARLEAADRGEFQWTDGACREVVERIASPVRRATTALQKTAELRSTSAITEAKQVGLGSPLAGARMRAKRERLRVLFVRPKSSGRPADGDNVVHQRAVERLSETMDVREIELEVAGPTRRIVNLTTGCPPEVARHIHPANQGILQSAANAFRPDVICLSHEGTFPIAAAAKATDAGVVLYAHNVHSQIADTDRGFANSLFVQSTDRFERRFYGDRAVRLVAMSESDARYLRERGVREGVSVAPPGAPPAVPLEDRARVEPTLVVSGNYTWWRKRRDLRHFTAQPANSSVAYYVNDEAARTASFPDAGRVADLDWRGAIRFGVITDRCAGGFKLKSTEYVARNCLVISLVDIAEEFAGLPWAESCIRTVASRAEAEAFARQTVADGFRAVERFSAFKAACLARYDWARTLGPLEEAILAAAPSATGRHRTEAAARG